MTADPLDDVFLGLAFAAFVEEAHERQGWPDSRAVKRRAYASYEAELRSAASTRSETGEPARTLSHPPSFR